MREPQVTFPMRELDRLKTIQAVVDGDLKPGLAAERLGLTVRQIERLVLRYRAEGPIGLISKHRNRPGNRGLKATLAGHVLGILREHYADFGPTLATEKLRTRHKVVLAKETVRQLQIASGLWIPRKLRPPKVPRQTLARGVSQHADQGARHFLGIESRTRFRLFRLECTRMPSSASRLVPWGFRLKRRSQELIAAPKQLGPGRRIIELMIEVLERD